MQLFGNPLPQSHAEPDCFSVDRVLPVSSKEVTLTLGAFGYHILLGEDVHSMGVQHCALCTPVPSTD